MRSRDDTLQHQDFQISCGGWWILVRSETGGINLMAVATLQPIITSCCNYVRRRQTDSEASRDNQAVPPIIQPHDITTNMLTYVSRQSCEPGSWQWLSPMRDLSHPATFYSRQPHDLLAAPFSRMIRLLGPLPWAATALYLTPQCHPPPSFLRLAGKVSIQVNPRDQQKGQSPRVNHSLGTPSSNCLYSQCQGQSRPRKIMRSLFGSKDKTERRRRAIETERRSWDKAGFPGRTKDQGTAIMASFHLWPPENSSFLYCWYYNFFYFFYLPSHSHIY